MSADQNGEWITVFILYVCHALDMTKKIVFHQIKKMYYRCLFIIECDFFPSVPDSFCVIAYIKK